ncbi:hypothetical protein ACRAKI_09405 [Saccharothrix isguenensis]
MLDYDSRSVRGSRRLQAVGDEKSRGVPIGEVDSSVKRARKPLLTISDESGAEQDSPEWMDSWQALGARMARVVTGYVPSRFRKVVVAAAAPTREYAAVMAALGIVRLSYRDRVLPDPEFNFHRLAALPPRTMVRAVMAGGGKVEVGPVMGVDSKGNLKFGRKSLSPPHCADISQAPWAQPDYREQRYDIAYDSAFIRNMLPTAQPGLFATEGRTACVVMGPSGDLAEEANLLVARPGDGARLGPVHEILRPFNRYGPQGWHSVICGTQSFDWPLPAAERGQRLLILDGAAAVHRWLGNIHDADIVLALVHRSDSSASAAAEAVLNQRRSAERFDLREIGWTPPPAVEAVAFGEPV